MIGSLRGRLVDRGADEVLVEVAGVGYRVTTSPTTALALGDIGDEVFLWVHHHVREDAETLFGFPSREERVTFEALLGAHGVGPSLALAILSVHAPKELARILVEDDLASLCLVPGVGKKTAARLLVELKSRLDIDDSDLAAAVKGMGGGGSGASGANGVGESSARADVRAALTELGYTPDEIRAATADLPDDGDVSELLRKALSVLAAGR